MENEKENYIDDLKSFVSDKEKELKSVIDTQKKISTVLTGPDNDFLRRDALNKSKKAEDDVKDIKKISEKLASQETENDQMAGSEIKEMISKIIDRVIK